jgi:hypothetical protein
MKSILGSLLSSVGPFFSYVQIPPHFTAYLNGHENSDWPLVAGRSDCVILIGDQPYTLDFLAVNACRDGIDWSVKVNLTVRLDEAYFIEKLQRGAIGRSRPVPQLTAESLAQASRLQHRLSAVTEAWIAAQDSWTFIQLGSQALASETDGACSLRHRLARECERFCHLKAEIHLQRIELILPRDEKLGELAAQMSHSEAELSNAFDCCLLARSPERKLQQNGCPTGEREQKRFSHLGANGNSRRNGRSAADLQEAALTATAMLT